MKNSVSISSIGTISPLGMSPDEIWKNYLADDHFFQKADFDGLTSYAGFLPGNIKKKIEALGEANSKYRNLDNSVLYAMLAGRI
ncbi:MAG: beta-ketoacyl synthase, partial [Gramella sp.]|nr:beta-ketoacyl synthase [Christiangramia sp.]